MNMKNLILIAALAAGATLSNLDLNAAEPALSTKATACCAKTVQATTVDPDLRARNSAIAASPKTLANFPQLGKAYASQPKTQMAACGCCKS